MDGVGGPTDGRKKWSINSQSISQSTIWINEKMLVLSNYDCAK